MRYCILLCLFISSYHTVFLQTTPTQANLLGQWSNDNLVGSSAYDNTYNEVWGLAHGNHEYAVIGSTAGTHFIDITDPANAFEADFIEGADTGPQIIHRDYHNYGCYLYAVADEGESSLQIIDLSYLPDSVSVVYDSNESLIRAHNIFIDTVQARLYALAAYGGEANSSALRIYDISDPVNPNYIAEYNTFGGVSVSHVHDAHVHDGLAYLNCGFNGLAIVDFSDPLQPATLGWMNNYLFAGYNHSGWPSLDGNYYYLGDETHGFPMKVVNVSDPEDIYVESTLDVINDNQASTIVHNQIVACNYLYVSYYYDGMAVYDISTPSAPQLVLYYDTSTWVFDNNYRGAWGVYPFLPSGNILISDMQEGLFIVSGPDDNCFQGEESRLACTPLTSTNAPLSTTSIQIYPQPAHDHLIVEIPIGQTINAINILDINGRVYRTFTPGTDHRIHLDINDIPKGIYLLEIHSAGNRMIRKLLID